MGCDIHMVVERFVNEKWIAVRLFDGFECRFKGDWDMPVARSRNYERFAALAGVRGDGSEPRGLPGDLSDTAKHLIEKWGEDGHSHSWLPLDEAVSVFLATEWKPEERLSDFDRKCPAYYYFGYEDEVDGKWPHRLIFWFDN